ncbi:MAG: dihydrodipicolinate reductase [Planctomycetota bacterium]
MLRVLQVGLGPLGQKVAGDLIARELGTVVAAVDPAAEIVGQPLSELVPGAGEGEVLSVVEEVPADEPIDAAVVTTLSDLDAIMPTMRALLDRGYTVVSTCEELAWPWLRHPIHAQELGERAVRNGGRVLGTGVNPGFLMDAFPVAAATACHSVSSVRVTRLQDASPRRVPFQRKIGAGLDDAGFAARRADGSLRHVGLGESLHLVGHYLGLRFDRWDEELEPVQAERELECALGTIPAGHAAGVRQVARGWTGDRLTAELIFQAAIGQENPHDRVEIEGEPPVDLVWRGGMHGDTATSAIVLNSIRALRAAAPGLHTMATLPMQGCVRRGGR